jgi:hypothetical protein
MSLLISLQYHLPDRGTRPTHLHRMYPKSLISRVVSLPSDMVQHQPPKGSRVYGKHVTA